MNVGVRGCEWGEIAHFDFGLKNAGQSSSMNASVQVLMHVPIFLKFLDQLSVKCKDSEMCLLCQMVTLRNILINKEEICDSLLEKIYVTLDGDYVHDVFDIFVRMLSEMHHNFKSHQEPELYECTMDKSPIFDIFGGLVSTNSHCVRCDVKTTLRQSLLCLKLPSAHCSSIQEAITYALTKQRCVSLWCDKCHTTTLQKRTFAFHSYPSILCIKLIRYSEDNKAVTVNDIQLDQKLQLNDGHSYNFISSILLDNGQVKNCAALLKCPNMQLILINDSQVSKLAHWSLEQSKIKSQVYMAFYQKQDKSLTFSKEKKMEPKLNKLGDTAKANDHYYRLSPDTVDTFNTPLQSTSKTWKVTPTDRAKSKVVRKLLQDANPDNVEQSTSSQPHPYKAHSKAGVSTKGQHGNIMKLSPRSFVSYELCSASMSDNDFEFFTGISKYNFKILHNLIGGHRVISKLKLRYDKHTPRKRFGSKLTSESRLFLMLVRLRRGIPVRDLGYVFGVSASYASLVFYAMIRLTYLTFKCLGKDIFLTRDQQRKGKPVPFKPFPDVRVIIDGAEFKLQRPSDLLMQGNTYSLYKGCNTGRFIIGISSLGGIIFVSEGFEGSKSEKEVFIESKLLDLMEDGDAIMCDRGFDIASECLERGVKLFKPPVLGNRDCFTPSEALLTEAIAAARIYVEHAVWSIKQNRLLRYTVPLTLQPILSDMVYVAAFLANFRGKNIKKHK